MNLLKNILLAGVLVSSSFLFSNTVVAEVCSYIAAVAPSSTTREMKLKQYPLFFSLPANYKTVQYESNSITVYAPEDYYYIECLRRNQVGTDNFATGISVSITPNRNGLLASLDNIETHDAAQLLNVNGKEVIVHYEEGLNKMFYMSFVDKTGNWIITVSDEVGYVQNRAGEWEDTGLPTNEAVYRVIFNSLMK